MQSFGCLKVFVLILLLHLSSSIYSNGLRVGAQCTEDYLPLLKNKRVAVVANQTTFIEQTHLVDSLLTLGIDIKKIFAPEHGFRGTGDAGEKIANNIDKKTGLPVLSLYGSQIKPTAEALKDIDIVIFDIQDVGVRFYTYISTMHYIMEACAEQKIPFLLLDRPNPNGFYVDGPVLEIKNKSFVGMHPVPLVHGMTIAEYARMINGEKWLKNGIQCELYLVLCDGYEHSMRYELPIKPSPNLPNMRSVYLYPALGLFEGTVMSCGRGTDFPFQVVGHPLYGKKDFSFTPRSIPGASKYPPHEGKICYGLNLRDNAMFSVKDGVFNYQIIKYIYDNYPQKSTFFNAFFLSLCGTDKCKTFFLSDTITDDMIFWKKDIIAFKEIRKKYLLYKDF
ncbi:MAG: DUF1343 domain-containing protein [Bacteroidales bacterium]|nr:DUF1343 domain-containing protein [Bacteroidales bacterium]